MTLQGPKLGAARARGSCCDDCSCGGAAGNCPDCFSLRRRAMSLHGVADTVAAHPLIVLAALALGGYLAHKHISPIGAIWGEHHASHSRNKALNGSRRRRKGHR